MRELATNAYLRRCARDRREAALLWALGLTVAGVLLVGRLLPAAGPGM